jgi:hypothetical protein
MTQLKSSGSQRFISSPLYFTPLFSSSATSAGSSIRVVINASGLPFASFVFNVPRMICSPTVASAILPCATSALNSL